jgi:hypothetical protein
MAVQEARRALSPVDGSCCPFHSWHLLANLNSPEKPALLQSQASDARLLTVFLGDAMLPAHLTTNSRSIWEFDLPPRSSRRPDLRVAQRANSTCLPAVAGNRKRSRISERQPGSSLKRPRKCVLSARSSMKQGNLERSKLQGPKFITTGQYAAISVFNGLRG